MNDIEVIEIESKEIESKENSFKPVTIQITINCEKRLESLIEELGDLSPNNTYDIYSALVDIKTKRGE